MTFEEWKRTDEYVALIWTGTNGAGVEEAARAAWNAALRSAAPAPESNAAVRYLLATYSELHRNAIVAGRPFVEVATGNMPHFLIALRHVLNTFAKR